MPRLVLVPLILSLLLAGSGSSGAVPLAVAAGSGSSDVGWLSVSVAGRASFDAAPPSVVAGAPGFGWPLDGRPAVVRRFDPPPRPWLPGHRGVDLAGRPGAPVRSAGAGVVLFAGRVAGRGVVTIGHAGGLRTTYEPVEPAVGAGDEVSAGAEIARLAAGHAGCPVDACLHWGLRRGSTYLDPLSLLGLGRVRLLPLRPRG